MNDARCNNYIKNYDPKEFRYCSQYHNCIQQGCANQRNHPNGTDYRYCADHRCDHQDCTNPKSPPSSFCASHTCAAPSCLARSPGATGDAHDPSRHCDRHRMCATPGCRRFAHVNEHGVPSAHCGEHHCRFEQQPPCGNARAAGAGEGTCLAHTCEERGCGRIKTRYMPDAGGVAGRYYLATRCRRAGCDARVVEGGTLCLDHTCRDRSCQNERSVLGRYCTDHKCSVQGCQQLRETVVLSQTMMMLGVLSLNLPLSPYCRAHVCGQEGCAEPAAGGVNGGASGPCE
ncbi:hypothetical protein CPAR01_01862 [Colletotrichum paranaense]|uniref:WRKY transcription factor 19 n=1 Tax=Colletotrichum paranaense TaxID=1914294 RepID=A0ABQ9SXV8_9PEZI|nr:uncharacterized protein CPAR01_01862 [Colletotrichum paranaense]KAK1544360.1 hypothetical protein CPAR01_01862 [Colletotrichum paranaense]